jgi:hypothetical protein
MEEVKAFLLLRLPSGLIVNTPFAPASEEIGKHPNCLNP